MKSVFKLLTCDKDNKQRIINDLTSDINISLENGEKIEDILHRLGTPEEYVRDFNESLPVVKKSNRKLIVGLICGVGIGVALFLGYQYLSTPTTFPIEESDIFNKDEILSASQQVIDTIDKKDYQHLETFYTEELLQAINKNESSVEEAVKQLGELGSFQKISDYQFVELKDNGEYFALGEVVTTYEKRTVIYRLTFDENMKLAGIYMR